MNFLCLDVETANESRSSICQIGIAAFLEGQHVPKYDVSLQIDPEDYFLDVNIGIHGIDASCIVGSLTFPQLHEVLTEILSGNVVLSHSHFDRVSLQQASAKYGLSAPECTWLDTLRVARRAWPERRTNGGHSLRALAKHCGIDFHHHSALEDARCAGLVFLQACKDSGLSLEGWIQRVAQPVVIASPVHGNGNPKGHMFGEILVFTGQLSRTRGEMAKIANHAGCQVDENVTKHTTIVVVGDQDVRYLKQGTSISAKHQKARELVAKGNPLTVMAEADFLRLLATGL